MISAMASLYAEDLAYIQAAAFGTLARGAAPEVVRIAAGNGAFFARGHGGITRAGLGSASWREHRGIHGRAHARAS